MSERLEFRYSPREQLKLMALGCALVAASWFVAATRTDVVYRTAGWLGIGFFTLCTFIAAKRLLHGGVPFVFDLTGISFPSGRFGLLPWTEVSTYAVVTVRGNYFLAFNFHDPARVLSRVSAAKRKWSLINHRLGRGHWSLTFSGVTPGLGEAVAFIHEHSLVQPAA